MNNLLNQVKNGSMEAFQELYNKFYRKVLGFALLFLESREEAEEIVHDVFLKVWEKREGLNTDYSFCGYLFRITKNLTLNKLKKKKVAVVRMEEVTIAGHSFNQTEEEVFLYESERLLNEAIEALPPKRQEIFRMSRAQGLSNKEIANRLDISINTVESQMRKALKYLRAYMNFVHI